MAWVEFYSQSSKAAKPGGQHVNFLVTSGPYPSIERRFNQLLALHQFRLKAKNETDAIEKDMELVVERRVQTIGLRRGMTLDAQSELDKRLTSYTDKTFSWMTLMLHLTEDTAS